MGGHGTCFVLPGHCRQEEGRSEGGEGRKNKCGGLRRKEE